MIRRNPGPAHHLQDAVGKSEPHGQRAAVAGRDARRPGGDLSADDPRGRLCHAGLCPDRRHPFDRLRRLLARRAGQPDQRLRRQAGDHRRQRPARWPSHAAEIQHRCRPAALFGQGALPGGQAHRRPDPLDRWPRCRSEGADGAGQPGMPAAPDGGRGSAVHPVHLGSAPASPRGWCTPRAAIWSMPR